MMAAAAFAAASAFVEVFLRRDPAQLEGLAHVLGDEVAHLERLILGLHEAARDGVVQECGPLLLEALDLVLAELHPLMLLVVEILALFREFLILRAGRVIDQKLVDPGTHVFELGLIDDGLAKLAGLVEHGGFKGRSHKSSFRWVV